MAVATNCSQPAGQVVGLPALLYSRATSGGKFGDSKLGDAKGVWGTAPVPMASAIGRALSEKPERPKKPEAVELPVQEAACSALAAQISTKGDDAFWTATAKAREDQERVGKVGAFLEQHGFGGVNHSVGWITCRYPLHIAVEQADASMVQMLLDSDAKRRVFDSRGLTPLQLARTLNTAQGSHGEILEVFERHTAKREADKKRRRDGAAACAGAAPAGDSSSELRLATSATAPLMPLGASQKSSGTASQDAEVQCSLGELPKAADEARAGAESELDVRTLERALHEERSLRLALQAELNQLRQRAEQLGPPRAGSGDSEYL